MNTNLHIPEELLRRDRNVIAAALSIVPGLGHIYKGHYGDGATLTLLVTPIVVWAGVLLSLATLGLGLLLPVLFWGFVGYDAYFERDDRKHHFLEIV